MKIQSHTDKLDFSHEYSLNCLKEGYKNHYSLFLITYKKKSMNLYLLSQNENNEYNTYDSCVVLARNEEEAKNMHPAGLTWGRFWSEYAEIWKDNNEGWFGQWASHPSNVKVKYLGVADPSLGNQPKVICASFNAG